MKVVSVVGARPQFVKLAPVARAARERGVEHVVVHTGPAYHWAMHSDLFDRFNLPAPDLHLDIAATSPARTTADTLVALEGVLADAEPEWVMAYGDTATTLATALAAATLRLPLAHLEAGLRSFNRAMPQEHHRVLVDHTADLLLAPTAAAADQLTREGLGIRTRLVGDVMVDVLLAACQANETDPPVGGVNVPAPYVVATLQRSANIEDASRLRALVAALRDLPIPVILVTNPRLFRQTQRHGVELTGGSLVRTAPLTYRQMIQALRGAAGVVTDSAGLQKEAYVLGVPCTTVRAETEWPETLELGWNVLAPDPADLARLAVRRSPPGDRPAPFGDGNAAEAVLDALLALSPP